MTAPTSQHPTRSAAGKYATILADPPWDIQQKGTNSPPYPLMSVEAICTLSVGRLAAERSHLCGCGLPTRP